jgi:hypothetical protein
MSCLKLRNNVLQKFLTDALTTKVRQHMKIVDEASPTGV